MPADYAILDLRQAPDMAGVVADRVWRAWWQDEGVPLAALRSRLDESLGAGAAGIPTTFVACRGKAFLGTVALIACDLEARAHLAPWLAPLWVEPHERGRGVGKALVDQAAAAVFAGGHTRVHLCATADNAPYYLRLGWGRIEVDVDGLDIFRLERG